jgi:hypothetical protein
VRGAVVGILRRTGCVAWVALCACSAKVPLGSWGRSQGGTGGGAGSSDDAGSSGDSGAPSCQRPGTPGPVNAPGAELGATITSTDWGWAAPSDSMETELIIEQVPPRDGYFWAYQFGFTANIGGFIGYQNRGGYQSDPPDGDAELTQMAVFWIGGAPLRAELGDIAYPRARTYSQSERGTQWWTIHAKYEFVPCRPYRLRVARHAQEANGDVWYGGWVRDTQTNIETFLGRILVPGIWGSLSTQSSSFTDRIGWGSVNSCDDPEYSSARFGVPSAAGNTLSPISRSNHFTTPWKCPSSRFTDLGEAGVRHELGIP